MNGTLVVALLGILLLVLGLVLDFTLSHRLPWVIRRFVPWLCFGVGAGLLLSLLRMRCGGS